MKLGHEVHIIGIYDPGTNYDGLVFHGLPRNERESFLDKAHLPMGSFSVWRTARNAKNVFDLLRFSIKEFDVVHCHYLDTAIGWLLARMMMSFEARSFLHFHNIPILTFANRVPMLRATGEFDGLFAVSEYVKQGMLKRAPFSQGKIRVVQNAIDPGELKGSGLSTMQGIPCDCIRMLYVGRIVEEKGLHHVVRAMALLKRRGRIGDLQLMVVGPSGGFGQKIQSGYMEFVRTLIDREGLSQKVHFFGNVGRDLLFQAYRSSDFLVVPSSWGDPCPTVVIEGMAFNKPVIAFRDGGIPEQVVEGVTGFLVEVGDVEALADKLELLCDDTKLRSVLGHRGAIRAESRFSFNVVANDLTSIYAGQSS